MLNFKNTFYKLSGPISGFTKLNWLVNHFEPKLILPMYHLVSDTAPEHINNLYHINTVEQFAAHLEILLKYYKPISLRQLIAIIKKGIKVNSPVFHLTFDDGLREFNDIIAPVLLKKGIPATCFLNSDFINNNDLFYRFKANLIINKLHSQPNSSVYWKKYHAWIEDNHLNNISYRSNILSINYIQRELLDILALLLKIDFNVYLKNTRPYMDESEINSLIQQGFTFGAHSKDHPAYSLLNEEEQIVQTADSINFIVKKFNLDYKVFSFPFTDYGVKASFFSKIASENIADLTFGCAGIKHDSNSLNLQRFPVEEYTMSFEKLLKKEFLYYQFLKLIGKNKIIRK